MIDSEQLKEIAVKLEAIETKVEGNSTVFTTALKNVNDSITKVVYGLLTIVAATVGVEFLPKSPIDWTHACSYAVQFTVLLGVSWGLLRVMTIKRKRV